MQYKAVFFDRDQTLTCMNQNTKQWVKQQMEAWSGKKYQMDYDRMMYLFEMADYPEAGLKSVEEEIAFWHRYYDCLLQEEGITEKLSEKVQILFEHVWLQERVLFPEVIDVLETLKKEGYKLGVISDSSPALSLTLESLGIAKYFDCFICSDMVGVMKPEPKIYQTALDALHVSAQESIYVDDYDIEADGARNMGFTAFHIQRDDSGQESLQSKAENQWKIKSLKEIVDFLHKI